MTGNLAGAAFQSHSGGFDGVGQDIMMLSVADVPNLCELSGSANAPTTNLRWLTVFICSGSASPVGDYVISPGNPGSPCAVGTAWSWLRTWSSAGAAMVNDATGTVTITKGTNLAAGTSEPVDGSLQVTFGDGSTFTGTFSLAYCPTLNQ